MGTIEAGERIETVRRTCHLATFSNRNHDLRPSEVNAGA
jgi:hypothetical protein